ncbi:hypothetical protein YC2023_038603 [Brassica napus]
MGNKLLLLPLLPLVHAYSGESTVRYLPGYQGPLPFELETGFCPSSPTHLPYMYIGVGEAEESQFFYYFIKSERTPAEDPLLIWLTGGPGCSSISAFLLENGPLAFNTESDSGNIPSLVSTTYSWSKVANIIYLDQPVGTGFSYSRNPLANIPSDTRSAKLVPEFVHKWLAKHPEYFYNPFYVTGNSYAGKVVPAITQQSINSDTIQTNGNHFTATQTNGNHFTATNTNHNTKFHLIPNLIDTYILLKEKYTNLFPNEMKQGCFDDGESVSDREWVPWLQPTT